MRLLKNLRIIRRFFHAQTFVDENWNAYPDQLRALWDTAPLSQKFIENCIKGSGVKTDYGLFRCFAASTILPTIRTLAATGFGGILADEMGLGWPPALLSSQNHLYPDIKCAYFEHIQALLLFQDHRKRVVRNSPEFARNHYMAERGSGNSRQCTKERMELL